MSAKPSSPTCLLLSGKNPYLNECALLCLQQTFQVLKHVSHKGPYDEEELAELKPDFVFSFISNHILRGPLLGATCINFHPAPPEWPGKGSASLALFNGDKTYGATAHYMVRQIDAGAILKVLRFPVLPDETCESLFIRAEQACLQLLYDMVAAYTLEGKFPEPNGDAWTRKAVTNRQFEEWLVLDPANSDEFHRKVAAARHSRLPGPYVILHGHRFALVNKPAAPSAK